MEVFLVMTSFVQIQRIRWRSTGQPFDIVEDDIHSTCRRGKNVALQSPDSSLLPRSVVRSITLTRSVMISPYASRFWCVKTYFVVRTISSLAGARCVETFFENFGCNSVSTLSRSAIHHSARRCSPVFNVPWGRCSNHTSDNDRDRRCC